MSEYLDVWKRCTILVLIPAGYFDCDQSRRGLLAMGGPGDDAKIKGNKLCLVVRKIGLSY